MTLEPETDCRDGYAVGAIVEPGHPRAPQLLADFGIRGVPAGTFVVLMVQGAELQAGDAATIRAAVQTLLALRDPWRGLLFKLFVTDPDEAADAMASCVREPWRRFDA